MDLNSLELRDFPGFAAIEYIPLPVVPIQPAAEPPFIIGNPCELDVERIGLDRSTELQKLGKT